jgi:hypothetical protein
VGNLRIKTTKFWIGDNVIVGNTIPAKITGILLREDRIEYQCSYFYEGSSYTVWLDWFEIQAEKSTEGKIVSKVKPA